MYIIWRFYTDCNVECGFGLMCRRFKSYSDARLKFPSSDCQIKYTLKILFHKLYGDQKKYQVILQFHFQVDYNNNKHKERSRVSLGIQLLEYPFLCLSIHCSILTSSQSPCTPIVLILLFFLARALAHNMTYR